MESHYTPAEAGLEKSFDGRDTRSNGLRVRAGIELTSAKGEHRGFVDPQTQDGRPALDDLWVMPMEGDRKPRPFLQTPFFAGGSSLSPDGRWLIRFLSAGAGSAAHPHPVSLPASRNPEIRPRPSERYG